MNALELIKSEIRELYPYKVDDTCCAIKLDANENPYPLPAELKDKVRNALNEVSLNRYPDPYARELKRLISHWLSVPEDCLMLGNGSDGFISTILISSIWRPSANVFPQ